MRHLLSTSHSGTPAGAAGAAGRQRGGWGGRQGTSALGVRQAFGQLAAHRATQAPSWQPHVTAGATYRLPAWRSWRSWPARAAACEPRRPRASRRRGPRERAPTLQGCNRQTEGAPGRRRGLPGPQAQPPPWRRRPRRGPAWAPQRRWGRTPEAPRRGRPAAPAGRGGRRGRALVHASITLRPAAAQPGSPRQAACRTRGAAAHLGGAAGRGSLDRLQRGLELRRGRRVGGPDLQEAAGVGVGVEQVDGLRGGRGIGKEDEDGGRGAVRGGGQGDELRHGARRLEQRAHLAAVDGRVQPRHLRGERSRGGGREEGRMSEPSAATRVAKPAAGRRGRFQLRCGCAQSGSLRGSQPLQQFRQEEAASSAGALAQRVGARPTTCTSPLAQRSRCCRDRGAAPAQCVWLTRTQGEAMAEWRSGGVARMAEWRSGLPQRKRAGSALFV